MKKVMLFSALFFAAFAVSAHAECNVQKLGKRYNVFCDGNQIADYKTYAEAARAAEGYDIQASTFQQNVEQQERDFGTSQKFRDGSEPL